MHGEAAALQGAPGRQLCGLHSARDDRTFIVYSQILAEEQATTAAGFWIRAAASYSQSLHRL